MYGNFTYENDKVLTVNCHCVSQHTNVFVLVGFDVELEQREPIVAAHLVSKYLQVMLIMTRNKHCRRHAGLFFGGVAPSRG